MICLNVFISIYQKQLNLGKLLVKNHNFWEVFLIILITLYFSIEYIIYTVVVSSLKILCIILFDIQYINHA